MKRSIYLFLYTLSMGFGTLNLVACDSDKKSSKRDRDDDDEGDEGKDDVTLSNPYPFNAGDIILEDSV